MPEVTSQAERLATAAEFGVFCPGILDVLSIGKGDLRLSVGDNDEDRDQARALIQEMLEKGYSIFVETDDGPVRVHEFNPHRMTYVLREIVPALGAAPEPRALPAGAPTKPRRATKRTRTEIPVAGSKATAVGRTAGG